MESVSKSTDLASPCEKAASVLMIPPCWASIAYPDTSFSDRQSCSHTGVLQADQPAD